jgi:glycosyltransferase involved in cell wall biosynthesis
MSLVNIAMTETIRVLHIVDSLNPGGMENGVVNVARVLAEGSPGQAANYEISACCLGDRGSFAERMPDPESIVALEKAPGFQWKVVRSLAGDLKRWRPDIVHTHNLGPLIYASLATRFGKRYPIVHGEHGVFDTENRRWKRLWQRRFLYRNCAAVHTVSPSLMEDIRGAGLQHAHLCSIRNGVDTKRFCPHPEGLTEKKKARCKAGFSDISEDALMIGIVGRFGAHKGHMALIEALELLLESRAKTGMNVHLVVAGDGGAIRDQVVERMRNSIQQDRIHWVGHRDDPEAIYPTLDLMVFPSSHEGLSNALLEAMACGVPVLGADACGNDEVIVDGVNGWLRDLGTAHSIAREISEIFTKPIKLKSAGLAARRTVVNGFSVEAMADGYRHLYERVVDQ